MMLHKKFNEILEIFRQKLKKNSQNFRENYINCKNIMGKFQKFSINYRCFKKNVKKLYKLIIIVKIKEKWKHFKNVLWKF